MCVRSRIRYCLGGATALLAGLLLASAASAASVGSIKSEGRVSLESGVSGDSMRLGGDVQSLEAGDRLQSTGNGRAVVTLTGGGSVGLDSDSILRVTESDSGTLGLELEKGRILYSFPTARTDFEIFVNDFVIRAEQDVDRMMVSDDVNANSGMIEHLDDGNVRVSVQYGHINVANGSNRYQVNAGEQIGLLSGSFGRMDTQMGLGDGTGPVLEIESPEQVRVSEDFVVRWYGDVQEGDYLVIAPAGSDPEEFTRVTSTDEGEVLEFTAPGETGEYEIRHVRGDTGDISTFVFLDVVTDGPVVAWWTRPEIIGGLAFAAGSTALIIGSDEDDEETDPPTPPPVSP